MTYYALTVPSRKSNFISSQCISNNVYEGVFRKRRSLFSLYPDNWTRCFMQFFFSLKLISIKSPTYAPICVLFVIKNIEFSNSRFPKSSTKLIVTPLLMTKYYIWYKIMLLFRLKNFLNNNSYVWPIALVSAQNNELNSTLNSHHPSRQFSSQQSLTCDCTRVLYKGGNEGVISNFRGFFNLNVYSKFQGYQIIVFNWYNYNTMWVPIVSNE